MTYLISQHSIPKLLKWTFIIFRILGTVYTLKVSVKFFHRFFPVKFLKEFSITFSICFAILVQMNSFKHFFGTKIGLSHVHWNDKRHLAKTFCTSMMIVHYFVQFVLMILLLPREKFNFIPQGILLNTQRKKNIWDSAVHLARGMGKMVVVIQIVILWNVYMIMVSVMVISAWTKYTHITIQWLLSIIYSTTSTS